jgi:hypothetical protein
VGFRGRRQIYGELKFGVNHPFLGKRVAREKENIDILGNFWSKKVQTEMLKKIAQLTFCLKPF